MQQDSLPRQPVLFCDRPWLPVKSRAPQQAKRMQRFRLVTPSFELSCVRDVLPERALLRAIRLG